ncbi:MAG: T9SS type A sorting domain-containing protein [Flavobacterium sp.]|nr:T9SS type A sorting domain-containing protein [Flavobacterium sp.]
MKKIYFLFVILLLTNLKLVAQNKILFDNTKAETASNADWTIDSDLFNLGIGSSGSYIGGSQSNPQRYPTPAQSTITATTPETYWTGGISYWGIDCVKKGYNVETLPWNGQITYGVATNPQDLSNYKAFVVDEPNILFTAAQKTAILNFVANGGGLFMISDHDISDRNGDGYDSPHIWNDLMTTNTVAVNPFGISFDYLNFSGTYSNILNSPSDPILHGTTGNVTQVKWSGGTTMTLNTTQNSSVKGVVFKTGTSGLTNVLCAYGTYGLGKFVAIGDSSPPDDGSGDSGDTLYDGYITDASGNHQRLLMNATNWLMSPNLNTETVEDNNNLNPIIYPNPSVNGELNLQFYLNNNEPVKLCLYDTLGRNVKQINENDSNVGINRIKVNTNEIQSGIYVCKLSTNSFTKSIYVVIK